MIIVDSSCLVSSLLRLPSYPQNHTLTLLKTGQIIMEQITEAVPCPFFSRHNSLWKVPVTSLLRSLYVLFALTRIRFPDPSYSQPSDLFSKVPFSVRASLDVWNAIFFCFLVSFFNLNVSLAFAASKYILYIPYLPCLLSNSLASRKSGVGIFACVMYSYILMPRIVPGT